MQVGNGGGLLGDSGKLTRAEKFRIVRVYSGTPLVRDQVAAFTDVGVGLGEFGNTHNGGNISSRLIYCI